MQALQESEALNRSVLNSLPANIAILKADGKIQAVNEAWQRFAQANGDPPASAVDRGADYLEVCRQASAAGPWMPKKRLPEFKTCWQAARHPSKYSIPAIRLPRSDGFTC